MAITVAELAVRLGCEVLGDPDVNVHAVATLQNATPGTLTFLANPRYRGFLPETRASAVVLSPEDAESCPVTCLVSDNPYASYARAAALLHPVAAANPGIHASAVVAAGALVDDSASIGPNAVLETGVVIGAGTVIGAGCCIGADSQVGASCHLYPNVTVYHGVTIGDRTIVHSGAVIGADGFGIAQESGAWIKVPQTGGVTIGCDVEIGASTTVDRGAVEDTRIGDGVKLDNQIQIAHNVRIGDHTVIAACSGVSGSTTIGRRCMIAGAVGFVGHLDICDDVVITGQTMVSRSISEPGVYSSALPMDDARRWRRNSARFRHLDELARRLIRLEKTVQQSKEEGGQDE